MEKYIPIIIEAILENWLERSEKYMNNESELFDINSVRMFLNKPILSKDSIK